MGMESTGVADCHWRVVPGLGCSVPHASLWFASFPLRGRRLANSMSVRWAVDGTSIKVLTLFFWYVPGLPSLSRSWSTITQPDRPMPGDECRVVVVVVVGGDVVVVVGVDIQDSTFLVDQNEFTLSSLSLVYQIPHAIPPFPCSLDCNSWIRFLDSEFNL